MRKIITLFMLFALLVLSTNAFAASSVSIPNTNADAGASVEIPVNADLDIKIGGFQFNITYNPAVLNCTDAVAGTLAPGWFLEKNPGTGQYIILGLDLSGSGTGPGTGSLVKLQCTAVGNTGASTSVAFSFAELGDENANPVAPIASSGTFTIGGACVPSTEVCDGQDNDCDGTADNGIAAVPTTCGVGACAATGQSTCQGGQMVDTCTPGTPGTEGPAGNATCSDQADNDCDGTIDTADQDCGGQCVPSTEVCDGQDNDCDGTADNGIAAVPTTCGVGACAATGQSTCQGGQMVDSCAPGQAGIEGPAGNATCSDQADNDCDGTTDAADASCQGTQSGMGQWVGTWFSVKGTLKGSTFRTPDSKFLSDKDVGNGYIHIWSWDPDTKELHYDYYEYIKNEGKWESYTEKLHFFAGTDLKFLFSYNNTAENFVNAFTGVIEGKVQKGTLKSATMKSLGGYYTEVYNDNTLYSTGLQTVTGKMVNASKVPVPTEVIIQH